ncbi:nectin-2-like isoform X2 [Ambystoma mexicanum]|uniref:nectin-2-like isoform X2 n=1 Tax=Ambystoma mexicanum TaxID=8296 RepID=UPI0037E854F0
MGPRAALLLLSLACSCSAQKVKVRAEVTGYVGQDVTLPCTYSPDNSDIKITQVTWMKETGGKKTNVAVYSPNWGKNLPNPRISFLKESLQEPTLVIKSLMMTDEGTYGCEFATYPDGNEEGTTRLILLAEPRNSAAAVPGAVGDAVGDREITVANCTSANGKPPSDITWQSVLPGNVSTRVINNTDGTITVNSQYKIFPTSEANGKTVTCIIASRTASVPQNIPVVLSIQYPPEVRISGYDDNWYINRQQAELTCTASGNPPPSKYEWKTASGQPLPNTVDVVGNLLVVKTVDNLVNTTFLCQATNSLGTSSAQLEVLVRASPNTAGAGATGGIIGGIIAAIVGIAVVATVVMIWKQQRKNQTLKDDDDLEGPPAYKPPPPSVKLQPQDMVPVHKESDSEESVPLKPIPFESLSRAEVDSEMNMPLYQDAYGDQGLEHSEHMPSTEDDYLEQINPIYNDLSYPATDHYQDSRGFVMSKAMYV